ncbi:hypothetical protein JZ751_018845 [Albula glossodonta]|uniref:Uncharacterized protein n=1 Tax=Albula glossodonta TaxID=121402 RepID=A0A8T2MTX7_9TELE|nr:hypothetical protein JZ751_018845 [Albula glossodonta]
MALQIRMVVQSWKTPTLADFWADRIHTGEVSGHQSITDESQMLRQRRDTHKAARARGLSLLQSAPLCRGEVQTFHLALVGNQVPCASREIEGGKGGREREEGREGITAKDVKALLPQINYRVPNMRFLRDKLQEVEARCELSFPHFNQLYRTLMFDTQRSVSTTH